MVYTLRFFFSSKCSLFHNSNVFGSCIIHILYTGCAKIKKNNSGAKRLIIGTFELSALEQSHSTYSAQLLIIVHSYTLWLQDCALAEHRFFHEWADMFRHSYIYIYIYTYVLCYKSYGR